MKISKNQLAFAVYSIAVLVLSLAFMLCDIFIPLDLWIHPVLNLLFCVAVGFGAATLFLGFKKRSSWYFFLSSLLLGLAVLYVLSNYIKFWIVLIIVLVLCAVFAVLSFATSSNKTEAALNDSPEYKNYEQRKAEEAELNPKEETEDLPEIKSFK